MRRKGSGKEASHSCSPKTDFLTHTITQEQRMYPTVRAVSLILFECASAGMGTTGTFGKAVAQEWHRDVPQNEVCHLNHCIITPGKMAIVKRRARHDRDVRHRQHVPSNDGAADTMRNQCTNCATYGMRSVHTVYRLKLCRGDCTRSRTALCAPRPRSRCGTRPRGAARGDVTPRYAAVRPDVP